MLFTQSFARLMASFTICTSFASQLPAFSESAVLVNQKIATTNASIQTKLKQVEIEQKQNWGNKLSQFDTSNLLACGTCGCEASTVAAVEGTTIVHKDESLVTDSLWGNLILEMAYQRDEKIKQIAKKMGIANIATMSALLAISGGTIAQGVTSLATLNPSDGHLDSYAPGIIGLSLGSATLLTFGARVYFSHKYGKQVKARQLAIKKQIDEILTHLEYSQAKCPDVHKELASLIGPRATGEFLQLWQSSHQLASTNRNAISMQNIDEAKTKVTAAILP